MARRDRTSTFAAFALSQAIWVGMSADQIDLGGLAPLGGWFDELIGGDALGEGGADAPNDVAANEDRTGPE